MDALQSARASRRSQHLLPALTPAPPSSRSAVAPHKLDQLQTEQPTDSSTGNSRLTAQSSKKPSAVAHIFFNRRPLDLIRRTTSSLLATGGSSILTGAIVAPPAAEERKLWQSYRSHGEKHGWRRLQQLQHKELSKDDHKQQHPQRRLRHPGDVEDLETERRKRHEHEPYPAVEMRRRPAPCPPTGKQYLLDTKKAAELTALEHVEIGQYDEIYFVSTLAIKRSRRNGEIHNDMPVLGDEAPVCTEESYELPTGLFNDGYDDEEGDYLVLVGDHLAFRYEVLSALGQGSFGQVVCCLDHRTRKQVAIKIIRNQQRYRDQALTEVQLLTHLQRGVAACDDEKPHVVHMEEYFQFRDHVCIVFEVLGMSLYDFLKMGRFRGVSMSIVRKVGKQLAQALMFLKQQQIIHCDLKPENVLLDVSSVAESMRDAGIVNNVKLIDFGSSCMEGASTFSYIQSRFYRSPEVLLGHSYSSAMDMWSFACILVELYTGHPIFAGENEREQFACIMEVLDVPPVDMVHKCKRRLNFFEKVTNLVDDEAETYVPKPFVNSRGRRRIPGSRSLASVVMTDDAEFLAFLKKCFVWEPSERLRPEQALKEPWIRCQYLAN